MWSGGTGSFIGGNTDDPTYNSGVENGTITLTMTVSNAPCTDAVDNVNLVINEALDAPTVNCGTTTTSSIEFNWNDAAGTNSYEVSLDGGVTWNPASPGPLNHNVVGLSLGESKTIQVRAIGGSCGALIGTTTCTAINCTAYTVSVTPPTTICSGTSTSITASVVGGTGPFTYAWDNGLPANAGPHTVSPATTTIYSVTVDDSGQDPACPNVTGNTTVTVNQAPTASAGVAPAAICQGGTTTALNGTATNGTILWTSSDPLGTFSNATIATPTYTASVNSTTPVTLTITVTGVAPCGVVTSTVDINVTAKPTANAGTDPAAVCIGSIISLDGTSANGTVLWTGGTGTFSDATIDDPIYTPGVGETGSVTLTMTVSNGECSPASDQVVVKIDAMPDAGTDETVCISDIAFALSGMSPAGGTWSGAGISGSNFDPALAGAGIKIITYTVGACSDTKQITVNALPNAGVDTTVCLTQAPFNLVSSTPGGTWASLSIPTPITDAVNGTFDPAIATAGVHVVRYTLLGCSDDRNVTVSDVVADAGPDRTICYGQTISVKATGGTTFSWNTGATTDSIVVNPTTNTTYTVTVSIGSCSDTDDMTVNVNPQLTVDAGSDVTICAGQSTPLNAEPTGGNGGPFTYSWVTPTGLNDASIKSPDATPASTTTYTVYVTDGCSGTANDDVIVTVNPAISLVMSPLQTICNSATTTLLVTPSGGNGGPYTYSWAPAVSIVSGQASDNPTVNPTVATLYTVYVNDGCSPQVSGTVQINLTPVITPDAGADQTTCTGGTVTLSASAVGGNGGPYTYFWSPFTGDISDPVSQTTDVTPAATKKYYVTIGDGCSPSVMDSVTVTILPPIDPGAIAPSTICLGQCATLLATPSGGNGGPYTYSWFPITGLSDGFVANPSACPAFTTPYTVEITDGCSPAVQAVVTITVSTDIVPSISPDVTICNGDATSLLASAVGGNGGPYSFSWDPAATLSANNIANPVANPTTTTTYTVYVNDGCSPEQTKSVTVTVEDYPADPVVNCGTTTISSIQWVWNPVTGATGYEYSRDGGTTWFIPEDGDLGLDEDTTGLLPSEALTLTVRAKQAGSCVYSQPVSKTCFSINCSPIIVTVTADPDTTICDQGLAKIQVLGVAGGTGNYTYAWDNGLGTTVGPSFVNPGAGVTKVYTVIVTDLGALACGTVQAVSTVKVLTPINVDAGPNVSICNSKSTTLSPVVSGGNLTYTYSWIPSQGLSNQLIASPVASPTTTTVYTLFVDDGCSKQAKDSVTVTVTPAIAPTATANPTTICIGQSVTLSASASGGSGGAFTYSWTASGGGTVDSPLLNITTASPSATTTYIVYVGDGGCSPEANANVVVTVNPPLTVNTGADLSICSGDSTQLNATVFGGDGDTYVYSWAPATGLSAIDIDKPIANPAVTTTYVVYVNDGCSPEGRDTVKVTVGAPLVATPIADATICSGGSTVLIASASGGSAPYNFSWAPNLGLDFPLDETVTATPAVTTLYTVYITDACPNITSTTVTVTPLSPLSVSASGDVIICNGEPTTLNATPSGGNGTYTHSWVPVTGLDDPTKQNPVATPAVTTTYTVYLKDGCSIPDASDEVLVTVNNYPDKPVVNCGTSTTSSVEFVWDAVPGATSYEISFDNGGTWASNGANLKYSISGMVENACTTMVVRAIGTLPCDVGPTSDPATCCANNCIAVLVSTTPDPSICNGQSTDIGVTSVAGTAGPFSYSWSGGLPGTIGPHTVTPTGSTNYDVFVTDSSQLNCPVTKKTIAVTVFPVISPFVSPLTATICKGSSATLTASATGGNGTYTFSWDPATGLSDSSIANPIASPSSDITYTVFVKDGCSRDTFVTIPVTVIPIPAVSAGNDIDSCSGTIAIITATGATTYEWARMTAPATIIFTGNPFTTSGLSVARTYIVYGTDATGCKNQDTVTVNREDQLAAPTISCSSVGMTFVTFGWTTVPNATGYEVSEDGGLNWITTNAGQTNHTIDSLTVGQTKTLYVRGTGGNCGALTANTSCTAALCPAITITTSQIDATCNTSSDASITIDTVGAGGVAPYMVSINGGAFQSGLSFAGLSANTFTIDMRDANACTAPQKVVTITSPAVVDAGSDRDFCKTQVLKVKLTGAPAGGIWTGSAGVVLLPGDTLDVVNTPWTVTSGIPHKLIYTVGACSDTANLIVTGAVAGSDTMDYCVSSGIFTLPLASPAGGTWSGPGILNASTGQVDPTGLSGPKTYTYTHTGCPDQMVVNFTPALGTPVVSCGVSTAISITWTWTAVTGATGYEVNFGFGWVPASGLLTHTENGKNPGDKMTIQVHAVRAGTCPEEGPASTPVECEATACKPITINMLPDVTVCPGANATVGLFSITRPDGLGKFIWTWSGDPALIDNKPGPFTVNTPVTKAYIVTVTDTSQLACPTVKDSAVVTVFNMTASTTQKNVSCFGGNDGSAKVTVSGVPGPFTYDWSPGNETIDSISGKIAGTYSCVISMTQAPNCQITKSVIITEPTQLIADAGIDDSVKCGSLVNLDGDASGGTSPYTFSWSNGVANQFNNNVSFGTYTLSVTDSKGCVVTDATTVFDVPTTLTMTNVKEVVCNGQTATSSVLVSGGTPPYSYQWDSGEITATITKPAGTYILTGRDMDGCIKTGVLTVREMAPLVISAGADQTVQCGNLATITGTVTSGTGPLTMKWDSNGVLNGSVTELIYANAEPGIYTLTVRDSLGCEISDQAEVISEVSTLTVEAGRDTNLCFGQTVTLTAVGNLGNPAYTFKWLDNSSNNPIRTFSTTGTFKIQVKDQLNCTAVDSVKIFVDPQLVLTNTKVDVDCFGNANGSIDLTVTGGTAPYAHSWSNNFLAEDPNTLLAGSYTVTVTDAIIGCSATQVVTIAQPLAALAVDTVSVTHVKCNGGATGIINLKVTGGTFPYTFAWSNGGLVTQNISNLSAGVYTVTVTDNNNCSASKAIIITQPLIMQFSYTQSNVKCFGGSDGSVDVTVVGGVTPYSFLWNDAVATEDRNNIKAGLYNLTVTDKNGCSFDTSITLTQPALKLSTTNVKTDVSCNGGFDGTIDVSIFGGTAPYTYQWKGGSNLQVQDITNIKAGTYKLVVTDVNGCKDSTSNIIVTEPTPIVITVAKNDSADCKGNSTGNIILSVAGGSSPYTYSWNNGGTSSTNANIPADLYSVTVTDTKGCTATLGVEVGEPQLLTANKTQTNVFCKGQATGEIIVSATGGSKPYQYSKDGVVFGSNPSFSNLIAGTYTLVVRDNKGCSWSDNVDISEPTEGLSALIDLDVSQDTVCNGFSTGTATVVAQGGTPQYNYSWSTTPPKFTPTVTGLSSGTYTVTVTDAGGCFVTVNAVIYDNPQFDAHIEPSALIVCYKDSATVNASVTGGSSPFTYSWNTGETTPTIWCKGDKVYQVYVEDKFGCKDDTTIVVGENDSIQVSIDTPPTVCFGYPTQLTATVNGGSGIFTYSWSREGTGVGGNTNVLTAYAGVYQLLVKDTIGGKGECIASSQMITVSEFPELVLDVIKPATVCYGDDGQAEVNVLGGAGVPFSYSWTSVNDSSFENVQGKDTSFRAKAGDYLIKVTDGAGCTLLDTVTFTQYAEVKSVYAPSPEQTTLLDPKIFFINSSEENSQGNITTWVWDYGDGTVDTLVNISGSQDDHSEHVYEKAGEFNSCLTVIDENGCDNKSCATVKIEADFVMFVPNAFTPSSDGGTLNPLFLAKGDGIESFQMTIFDRWGKVVAVTNTIYEGWNGKLEDGTDAPQGVYIWLIVYRGVGGNKEVKAGSVTLLR